MTTYGNCIPHKKYHRILSTLLWQETFINRSLRTTNVTEKKEMVFRIKQFENQGVCG